MSSEKNIIKVYFKDTHLTHSKAQYQYNHGMILHFADLDLPQAFETHFANKQHGNSKTVVGSENKVEIPDEYFWTGANEIYAWVYLHSDVDDGETVYEVRIPLVKRAKPTDEEPLPEQQSAIDRAIAELNHAVETTNADAEQTSADREAVTELRDEVIDLRDEAEQSAQTATAKANEASESASSASESEQNAHDYADDAKRYAENAFSSKEIAVASASDAEQAKQDAEQASDDAQDARSDTIQLKQDVVGLKDDVVNLKDDVIDLKEQTDTNVAHYPRVIDEYWHVWDARLGQFVNTNIKAQGENGTSPYILLAWFDTIFIPCDEDGICTETLTTSVMFYAFHGEDPVPCTVLEGTSEQNPLVDKNLRLWLVRPSTTSSVGIFSVAYTSGTDPFDGLEYDTYRENLIFTLDNGVTTTRHGFTFVKVKQGVTGEKGDKGDTGEKGDKGDKGNSGVYIGTEEPTDEEIGVWIDTDGQPDTIGLKYVKDDASDHGGVIEGFVTLPDNPPEGMFINTASGNYSHAEGYATIASGQWSHSENALSTADGEAAHAEGYQTVAHGDDAHSEGQRTQARSTASHAEGVSTVAIGTATHAEGYFTKASSKYQHVQGKYNVEDSNNTYADIVGNGTNDNDRSNAYTLDWNGNGVFAGKVTAGAQPTNANDLTTKQYVDGVSADMVDELIKVDNSKANVITDTTTGAVASFPDGADDFPMKSLKVAIEPVQDLHGQESPYPAGGGKNLCPKFSQVSQSGINVTVADDGTLTINGTATATVTMTVMGLNIPAGTYAFSLNNPTAVGTTAANSIYAFARNTNNAWVMNPVAKTANAAGVGTTEYPINAVVIVINSDVSVSNFIIKPQLEVGSTATAYAPYSNICPITGWTGAQVVRTGKNLLSTGIGIANRIENSFASTQIDTTNKTVTFNPISSEGYKSILYRGTKGTTKAPFEFVFPFKENTQYTFIIKATTTGNSFNGGVSYTDGTNNGGFKSSMVQNGYIVFTSPANKTVLSLYLGVYDGMTTFWYEEMGVYEGVVSLADADFTPRNTYSILWETEAGTVYSGTLDVVSGELVVDMAYVFASPTWTPKNISALSDYTRWQFYSTDTGLTLSADGTNKGHFSHGVYKAAYSEQSNHAYVNNTSTPATVFVVRGIDATEAGIQAYIAQQNANGTPLQVVYPLAEPIVYHLTPMEVRTLLGRNNVFADTGDSKVEYYADTKRYIDKKIAELVN